MTRPASALAFDGDRSPTLPVELQLHERSTRIERSPSGRVIVEGPDLHAAAELMRQRDISVERAYEQVPAVERQLVMVTGSHHYLAFWLAGARYRELRQLPFVYLLDESRWLPRREAFLQPPEARGTIPRWNANCIQCHSVAGRPGQSQGIDQVTGRFWVRYETEVAELGIACEACHGPGAGHARRFRDPRARYRAAGDNDTSGIVNPDHLSPARSSAVCGQCHSYFSPSDAASWWRAGFAESFEPGQALEASRTILQPDARQLGEASVDVELEQLFWQDGSIRVGGREYNGLVASPCFERAAPQKRMSCLSCHEMHGPTPQDQLAFSPPTNDEQCTQCHQVAEDHSKHPAESLGARCVSCHMPKVSYALLGAIRSHRITSPGLRLDEPPHACALCHADRDRQWLNRQLAALYGLGTPSATGAEHAPYAVLRAVTGDAAERAIWADHVTLPETLAAAGAAPALTVLPVLRRDPYAAVRHIARRSQRRLDAWLVDHARPKPLLSSRRLEALSQARDESPVTISE